LNYASRGLHLGHLGKGREDFLLREIDVLERVMKEIIKRLGFLAISILLG
jgi:hypothetical protein